MSTAKRMLVIAAALTLAATIAVPAFAEPPLRTYEVTITNLTDGQPMSPPVAVTHRNQLRLFEVGEPASPAIVAIAEDGNQSVAVGALTGAPLVTDVVDGGQPLTPSGTTVGPFSDSLTFEITARPGDRVSLATMLICTNDGFTGIDAFTLPGNGTKVRMLAGYDAGSEDNTEASEDIVDPCSALGPVALAGDPNGNENAAVDTTPAQAIAMHPGVLSVGDLAAAHDWDDPVAMVTITRVDS